MYIVTCIKNVIISLIIQLIIVILFQIINTELLELLKQYGVGRRKVDDVMFNKDKPPSRLGVYDVDDEELCHSVSVITNI